MNVQLLGHGAYTLSEAARLVECHPTTLSYWFRMRPDGKGRGPIFQSDYRSEHSGSIISFHDLIDALVVAQFRKEGVPFKEIRKAYDILVREHDWKHPFCRQELYTDGRKVILGIKDQVGDKAFVEAVTRQELFKQFERYLKQIDYSEASKLAERWNIAPGVAVDPAVHFGKPVVKTSKGVTGVSTYVLANSYFANERDECFAAELFGVRPEDVRNAVEFEQKYGGRLAA